MKNFLIKFKLLLFFILFISGFCFGQLTQNEIQQAKQSIENQYGYSFVLTNGYKYENAHSNAMGSPFFLEGKWLGKVILQGQRFDSLLLAYDIYQQQMVYCFKSAIGAELQLVLSANQIDTITFYGKGSFIKNPYNTVNTPFLNIIFEGDISCYFSWNKTYTMSNATTYPPSDHKFSRARKWVYIVKEDSPIKIKTNRNFIQLIKPERIREVKKYLRNNKIKVQKVSQSEMYELMDYCTNNMYFVLNDKS